MTDTGRLAGKACLIAGASSGIGRAVAEAFAREGGRLYLVARDSDSDELQEVGRSIGNSTVVETADLGDPATPVKIVVDAAARLGSLDILVNNAGFAHVVPALDTDAAQWDRMMAVNLRSMFLLSQAFSKHVISRDARGAIVNTASTNAIRPEPMQVAYNASKAAVISLTQSLALELGRAGIRVNAVMPAMVETRQTETLLADSALRQMYESAIPLGRIAKPEDVAPAYVFLASEEAHYVTGATLAVDGGLSVGIVWPEIDVRYPEFGGQ